MVGVYAIDVISTSRSGEQTRKCCPPRHHYLRDPGQATSRLATQHRGRGAEDTTGRDPKRVKVTRGGAVSGSDRR